MNKIAFYLFGIPVAWYGLIVTFAIVAAFVLFLIMAKRRGIDGDFSLEMFIWVVVLAVLCCRIFYVVPRAEYWPKEFDWEAFKNLFNIKQGGLTIIGGIFGGALGILFCCLRNKKYSFIRVADLVVIALLLGQIIGRWGNYVNGELYGLAVPDTWPQFLRQFPFAVEIGGKMHMGLFFYEGVLNAIGLAIALGLFFGLKKKLKPGTLTMFYLSWYGLVRGTIEFFKVEHKNFEGTDIGIVQVICYAMLAVGLVLLVLVQTGKLRLETKWFQGVIRQENIHRAIRQTKGQSEAIERNLRGIVMNGSTGAARWVSPEIRRNLNGILMSGVTGAYDVEGLDLHEKITDYLQEAEAYAAR